MEFQIKIKNLVDKFLATTKEFYHRNYLIRETDKQVRQPITEHPRIEGNSIFQTKTRTVMRVTMQGLNRRDEVKTTTIWVATLQT